MPTLAGKRLTELAEEDAHLVAVAAAMQEGTGLVPFFERYPARAFDVGIAEAHALTFAAGLAAAGEKPYVALYSTFLQRGYDNLLHDIALQALPVRILVDRAGLATRDGATHHGIFDVAFLSHIPGFRLFAPATLGSLAAVLEDSLSATEPLAIRYENRPESEAILAAFYPEGDYRGYGIRPDFKSKEEARDGVIITYGAVAEEALKAKEALQKEGVFVGILLLEILKPYDTLAEKLLPYLSDAPRLLFLEEGIYDGGAGMLLFDRLTGAGVTAPHKILAVRDHFAIPDKREDYRSFSHIAAADVVAYFSK